MGRQVSLTSRGPTSGYAAMLRKAKAARIKVEEVVRPHVVARAPEVDRAKTVWDKLCALWRARKVDRSPAEMERLAEKLTQLEGADDA